MSEVGVLFCTPDIETFVVSCHCSGNGGFPHKGFCSYCGSLDSCCSYVCCYRGFCSDILLRMELSLFDRGSCSCFCRNSYESLIRGFCYSRYSCGGFPPCVQSSHVCHFGVCTHAWSYCLLRSCHFCLLVEICLSVYNSL